MKKSNLLFVLSAFVLIGGITGCSTNEPSTSISTSTSTVATKHAVVIPTSVAGAYVTASRSEAIAGDSVELTVALTDPTNYELKSVKVGDKVLEGTADANNANVFHYSFVMGDADANVSVVTEQIVAPTKDHTISFEGKDLAFALEMPQDANVGEHVSFKVAARSGYEITSVKVVKVSAASAAEEGAEPVEEEVTLTGNAVIGYSFDMPDADVVIKAEALGAYFKVNADDQEVVFTAKGTTLSSGKLTVRSFVKNYKDIDGNDVYFTAPFFRAGSEVKIIAQRTAYTDNVKYFVNNIEMEAVEDETYLMYKFTMPASNANISITAEDKVVGIEVTNSEHASSSVYRKVTTDGVETEVPVTSAYPGETLYVDVHSNSETFKVEKPTSTMLKYSDFSKFNTSEYTSAVFYLEGTATDSDATYSFTVPTLYHSVGNFKIQTNEKELIYADKSFVGKYVGYEIYSNKFYSDDETLTLGGDGSTSSSWSSLNGKTISTIDETKNIIKLNNDKELYYEGNALWCFYSSYISDIYLFTKDITDLSKTTKYICKNGDDLIVLVYEKVEVTEDDQTVEKQVLKLGALILKTSNTVVLNIDVEMLSGANIQASGAKFLVKKNNAVIYSVGIGEEYGSYTKGDSTLVLNGAGTATLDGVEGTYVVDSTDKNKVTVTVNEVEHIFTIDKTAKTFVDFVEKVEEPKSLYSSFKGTTNNNTLTLNSDGTGTYNGSAINFTFVESTNKVTFSINGVSFDLTWDATAGTLIGTFNDDDNHDITFNIVAEETPFYVGTYTGKIANEDLSTKFDTTIVINQDGTGSYIHNGTTRTFTFVVAEVTIADGKATINAVDNGSRNLTITVKESNGTLDVGYTNSGTYFSALTITKQA